MLIYWMVSYLECLVYRLLHLRFLSREMPMSPRLYHGLVAEAPMVLRPRDAPLVANGFVGKWGYTGYTPDFIWKLMKPWIWMFMMVGHSLATQFCIFLGCIPTFRTNTGTVW